VTKTFLFHSFILKQTARLSSLLPHALIYQTNLLVQNQLQTSHAIQELGSAESLVLAAFLEINFVQDVRCDASGIA
jgi:hypothetical protein